MQKSKRKKRNKKKNNKLLFLVNNNKLFEFKIEKKSTGEVNPRMTKSTQKQKAETLFGKIEEEEKSVPSLFDEPNCIKYLCACVNLYLNSFRV